ncbi:MAG TPA: ImmA/IrrE family metallo-endopeptidase, partial [Nannocystaceae bacterium]|nr:ImmA/IrrE family metallo-endopeptidase [Nannocystaceae bacterium]
RLLTDSRTTDQSIGRAFATELLVPREALERRVGRAIDDEEIDKLATEFRVGPSVIRHQIDNHGLAEIVDS